MAVERLIVHLLAWRPIEFLLGGVLRKSARLWFRIPLSLMRAKLLVGRPQTFVNVHWWCLFVVFIIIYPLTLVYYKFSQIASAFLDFFEDFLRSSEFSTGVEKFWVFHRTAGHAAVFVCSVFGFFVFGFWCLTIPCFMLLYRYCILRWLLRCSFLWVFGKMCVIIIKNKWR